MAMNNGPVNERIKIKRATFPLFKHVETLETTMENVDAFIYNYGTTRPCEGHRRYRYGIPTVVQINGAINGSIEHDLLSERFQLLMHNDII